MEREKENKHGEKSIGLKAFDQGKQWFRKAMAYPMELKERLPDAFMREWGGENTGVLQGKWIFYACLAAVAALSAVIALACFPLKVYPAGFALLSSLGGTGKIRRGGLGEQEAVLLERSFLLAVFSGVLFSCLFLQEAALLYLLAYLILFFCRAGFTGGKMDESMLARVTASSATATGTGLMLAVWDEFSVNRIFAAVSFGIITPLISYLLCGFYIFTATGSVGEGGRARKKVYLEAGMFTLVYLFLYALREVEWMNFSLPFVCTVVLTLFTARERGPLYGAAMGMIGGMACASSSVAPALAVAGFFSGLFFEYSVPVALMVSFVSSCGYSMYSEGFRTFGLITADFLCGVLLFLPLCRLLPQKTSSVSAFAGKDMMHKETMRSAKQKLKRMSEAFSSLSEVFYTVSDSMKKPQLTEASRLVSDCCSEVCSRCSLSGICWGREHSLHVEASSRVASRLLVSGQVEKKDFGEPFATGCKNLEELCALVNRRFEELSGNFIKNNKTRLLAGEYSSVSRLLKNTAGELDLELEYNPGLEQRAKKVLKELGISYRRVAVFGTREIKIDVYGILLERVSLATDQVLLAFEREFHCVFDSPGFLMFEESVVMRLRRRRALSLECAKSGCTKKGESINGDSVSFFETDRDYFYTLICDGMGSGREAAFTSRLASIFIEKLMHCATPKNVSLEMLNAFLMSKTDETFTTVDLLEVDLLSGEANFMKAGAAPSFVLRGDRLHRIESRTPPAGVLYRMCAEQTAFSLRDGDFIIQLSDGAEENDGSSDWLAALVGGNSYENAAALCEQIFSKAKEQAAFRDDLSICVLRVVNSK